MNTLLKVMNVSEKEKIKYDTTWCADKTEIEYFYYSLEGLYPFTCEEGMEEDDGSTICIMWERSWK